MRKGARLLHAGIAACLLHPAASWSLPWSEDMRDQPSVKAQEAKVETNERSIPASGGEAFSPPADIGQVVRDRLIAGTDLRNPARRTPESVNRGKMLYDIHCALCHGEQGQGDGLVGEKFIPPPMDLTLDYVQIQPDGQIFYTISHGSVAMPYYRDSIPAEDRWHVVNYIKAVLNPK